MRSFYSPLSISAPFYGYFKVHKTERSRNKDVRSGNRTQDLLHQGRALTDCAICAPNNVFLFSFLLSVVTLKTGLQNIFFVKILCTSNQEEDRVNSNSLLLTLRRFLSKSTIF